MQMMPINSAPQSLTEMANYPGFAQWHAREGYYAPVLMLPDQAGSRGVPCTLIPLVVSSLPVVGTDYTGFVNSIPSYCKTLSAQAFTNQINMYQDGTTNVFMNAHSNIVMFTGLSPQSSLTIRVRYLLTIKPDDTDPKYLVLSAPKATFDPLFFEIYSRVCQQLPAGTSFNENPAGEWWKKMLGTIGTIAAPFLRAIPVIGGPLSIGASALSSGLLESAKEDEKRKVKNVPASPQVKLVRQQNRPVATKKPKKKRNNRPKKMNVQPS